MTTDTEKRLTDDLVKQLRDYASCDLTVSVGEHAEMLSAAADAIDRLTAERDAAWVGGRDATAKYHDEMIEFCSSECEQEESKELRRYWRDIKATHRDSAKDIRALSPSTLNKPE